MADSDVTVDDSADVERKIDTRTVGGANDEHRQVVVLGDPATAAGVAAVDAANGLDVDVTRIAAGAKIQLTDGTDDATISVAGARKPLDVHLIDSSGAVISTFGGAGGTSAADDADMTPGTTVATPIMGVREDSPTTVTDGDMGIAAIDSTRNQKVNLAVVSATAPAASIFRSLDLDETEEEVKSSAGVLYGMWVTNNATATRYIKFYNAPAASVIVGTTTPVLTIGIPGNSTDDVSGICTVGGPGVAFSSAICVAATTGLLDSDTGAPGANDVIVNIFYE